MRQFLFALFCILCIGSCIIQCDSSLSNSNPKEYKALGILYGRGVDTLDNGWISDNAIVPFKNTKLFLFHLTQNDSIINFQSASTDSAGKYLLITPFERLGLTLANSSYTYPDKAATHIAAFGWFAIFDFVGQHADSIYMADTILSPW